MTPADIFALALAVWAVTYHLTFGPLFEWLRRLVGIGYDLDAHGQPTDRWGGNPVAAFLNCPTCTAIASTITIAILWYNGWREVVSWLAVLGAATVIARWWTSQRTKAEWWR